MAETRNEYINYQNMVSVINTALSDMEHLCEQMKMEENRKELEHYQHKLSRHTFSVGIMGEFKRGKSTVINSLLEKEIMPADILPCSATMNRVTYDLHPHVQLKMRDGTTKDIPVEELASYVTKLNAENESRAAEVDEAVVYYPCRFCKNGVDIVDTPGLNDDERMNKISEEVIPKLDAVIMVLTPDNPFSMSEAEFVRNKLMASDLSRLIFVVNKIDTIRRAADRLRVVDSIREKIHKSVMDKMSNVYGMGSAEYEEAVKKMGSIRIYPLSALDALDGKIEGDQSLIEKSGTLEFEAALTKMLTEERGALELSASINVIARTAVEISKTVAVRKQALEMNAKEFEDSQTQALAEINRIREDKKQEKKRLRESSKTAKQELRQQLAAFYPSLRSALNDELDRAIGEVELKQLESDAGLKAVSEQLQNIVSKACQNEISLITEKLQNNLDKRIGGEAQKTGSFVSTVMGKLDHMNTSLFAKKGFESADLLATGAEALAIYGGSGIFGLGGAISGYKNAGIKGALVGGGVGFLGTMMTALTLIELSMVGMPAVIIAGLAGTMSGKFASKFLFRKEMGKKKLEEIKKNIKSSIDETVSDIQNYHELEDWCDRLVVGRYDELIARFEDETERLLKTTEASIDEIKRDITENEMQRKQIDERLDKVLLAIKRITEEDVAPISARVSSVLDNM